MHRHARTTGDRASALWARGAGGGDVGRRRGWTAIAVAVVALALPLAAAAADGTRVPAKRTAPAFVSEGLLQAATAHRSGTFHVIVVGQPGVDAGAIKNDLMKDARGNQFGHVRREFKYALDGLAAD